MNLKKQIGLFCLLLLAVGVLAGCYTSTPTNTGVDSTSMENQDMQEENAVQELTFSWNRDIGDLNPHTYLPNQFFAQAMIYEPLVSYDFGGEIKPHLAERWELSDDGKEYTFILRKDVTFSDGSPFNAEVVKKNFDTVLDNIEAHMWLGLIGQIESTEVVDSYTFVLKLKNQYYPALQELTLVRPLRFLSEQAFPEQGNTSEGIKQPVGTGPWALSELTKDEYAIFTRNESYWGEKPHVQKVTIKIIPDGETRVLAFEKGDLDFIYGNGLISLDSYQRLKESGKYEVMSSEPISTRMLVLNSNRGPTKDRFVRKAFQHAFDKQTIVDHVFYGTEIAADTLMAKNFPYSNIELKPYEYQLETAKQLLDEAGWIEKGAEYREKDGQVLEVELKYISTDQVQQTLAQITQNELKKIGVKVNLMGLEEQSFWDHAFRGEFDLVFDETWGAPYDPHSYVSAMRSSEHSSSSYHGQQGIAGKKELDEKIEEALLVTDEERRAALYKEIFSTLHEEAIYLPISYQATLAIVHKHVKDFGFLPTQYEVPVGKTRIEK